MNIAAAKLPKSTVALTVTLTPDEVQPYLERAAQRVSMKRPVPGFRPGNAPYDVMRKAVGDDVLYHEAVESIVRATYPKAVEREKLHTVGAPKVELQKVAPGNPFVYTAIADVLPEVTLGDYRTLKVEKRAPVVTDGDVDRVITDLRRSRAKETSVKRPAALGDKVLVDFAGFLDKVPIEGTAGKAQPLVLGGQHFVPGFEEHLVGMRPGETKEFTVRFPKDYHRKNMANRDVEFRATVQDVYAVELPALDDNFAKSFGPFENLAALRAQITKNLTDERRRKERGRYETALLEKIMEISTFGELPDGLIGGEVEKMREELNSSVAEHGVAFEQYLASIKKTEADLKKDLRPQAERRIKLALVSRAVAVAEKIAVDDEEVRKEIDETKKLYESNPEVLRNLNSPDYFSYLQNALTNRHVFEFLDALMGIEEKV